MDNLNNYFKGFTNIGNTCYLNSGLQLIINNKELCNIILQHYGENEIIDHCSNFIITYYNNQNYSSLIPNNIKDMVSKHNREFIGNKQNDTFEFLISFFEILCNLIKNNLYEINIQTIIKCKLKNCLNINIHNEKTNFLLLDINNDINSLDDSYRYFKSYEQLINENIYFCEKCNAQRIGSKKNTITIWPKHLIIVLKRFFHSGNSTKNNKEISIPIEWRHNYYLKGVVYHSGTTTGGHYIYIGEHNNKWIMFDDNNTNEISLQQFEYYKNHGYIYYFYQII